MSASALDLIIEWSQTLDGWQSDAIRRILLQGDVTEEDEKQLLLMLKERNGIIDPDNPAPKPQLLKKTDISGASPTEKLKITLKAMNGLENVNALPDGPFLQFAHEGVGGHFHPLASPEGVGRDVVQQVVAPAAQGRHKN